MAEHQGDRRSGDPSADRDVCVVCHRVRVRIPNASIRLGRRFFLRAVPLGDVRNQPINEQRRVGEDKSADGTAGRVGRSGGIICLARSSIAGNSKRS